LYVAHGIGTGRLSELGIINDCVPRRPCYVIQDISGVKAEVKVQAVFQAESAAETGIHGELRRSGDGIASGGAPLTSDGRGVGQGAEIGTAVVIGSNDVGVAGAVDGERIDGRKRKTCADCDVGQDRPFLEEPAAPTAEKRSSGESHAGGVLTGEIEEMALIEDRKAAFSAQVEPVLGYDVSGLRAAAEG